MLLAFCEKKKREREKQGEWLREDIPAETRTIYSLS